MAGASPSERAGPTENRSDERPAPQAVLEALADEDCRVILAALSEQPRTAPELSDRSAVARSTLYRKLDRLQSIGLVTTRPRVTARGPTVDEYVVRDTALQIECSFHDGFVLSVHEPSGETAPGP
jgi:DNA-binding transcriptional ArsR family regulator